MLQLERDFKLLKHNCKRFPMLLYTVKRLPMLKHNCKRLLLLKHIRKRLLFKQNYKEICLRLNTWYTISGVHNTDQIQTLLDSRISKIWTLIRNSRWTFDAEQFQQSLALSNCCISLVYVCVCISNQQVFTSLNRGVKDTLEIASTSKRVVWSLIKITNDLLPDLDQASNNSFWCAGDFQRIFHNSI